jgi:hypothetical protein
MWALHLDLVALAATNVEPSLSFASFIRAATGLRKLSLGWTVAGQHGADDSASNEDLKGDPAESEQRTSRIGPNRATGPPRVPKFLLNLEPRSRGSASRYDATTVRQPQRTTASIEGPVNRERLSRHAPRAMFGEANPVRRCRAAYGLSSCLQPRSV